MPPVDVVSKQTMHVLINGPDGANTLFITTGLAQVSLRVQDADGTAPAANTNYSFLLDEPRLSPGQFRRAIATAALASINSSSNPMPVGAGHSASLGITSVDADLDDETGCVELRFELHVGAVRGDVELARISFQVMTSAAM
jgi:hypothetical protein